MTTFRDRLKEAVADAGLTERQARARFQAELKMTRSNLSHWFGGRAKQPKVITVAGAAALLGVNPVWLATGKGQKSIGDGAACDLHHPNSSDHGGRTIYELFAEIDALRSAMEEQAAETRKHIRINTAVLKRLLQKLPRDERGNRGDLPDRDNAGTERGDDRAVDARKEGRQASGSDAKTGRRRDE